MLAPVGNRRRNANRVHPRHAASGSGRVREHRQVEGDGVHLVEDPLCLVQAAWAARLGPPRYGIPEGIDALEGWIVSA